LLWVTGGFLALGVIVKLGLPLGLWFAATAAGAPIPAVYLLGMRLRRTDPEAVVLPWIQAKKAGIAVELRELETLHLAGGDVSAAVDALIRADKAGTPRTWAEVSKEYLQEPPVGGDPAASASSCASSASPMASTCSPLGYCASPECTMNARSGARSSTAWRKPFATRLARMLLPGRLGAPGVARSKPPAT